MRLIRIFWSYFRENQPPLVRVVHTAVLALVLMQMLSSNLIRFDPSSGRISDSPAFFLGSWAHFSVGIALVLIGFSFVVIEIARHGFRYFFPYLWGDFAQLKADLKTLWSRRLPEAGPGSLAATVQGLGLGALVLTLTSGLGWFLLWQSGAAGMAGAFRSLHEGLTGLLQAYVVGHGGLGLLHIIVWYRTKGSAGKE
ncbi:MAG: cytochrome b/b6 domain-containing protein [Desulfobacteraceae bacterium]|jgi:hypothetical protein|nr:cytochrome b/b6 domain-containing protein [Desulfobacteraceae bacterium]